MANAGHDDVVPSARSMLAVVVIRGTHPRCARQATVRHKDATGGGRGAECPPHCESPLSDNDGHLDVDRSAALGLYHGEPRVPPKWEWTHAACSPDPDNHAVYSIPLSRLRHDAGPDGHT